MVVQLFSKLKPKNGLTMNAKLSRQQRRALERSQKKNRESTFPQIQPKYFYGPIKASKRGANQSAKFTHYIRAIEEGKQLGESEEYWISG